jgi:uncharacterized membrane protein YvbJ
MYCPSCGEDNPDDARFCGTCGAALPAPAPPTERERPAHQSRFVSSETRSAGSNTATAGTGVPMGLKIGIAAATVVIPLIGIVMGLMYLFSESADKKAAGRLWLGVAGVMFVIYCLLSGLGNL